MNPINNTSINPMHTLAMEASNTKIESNDKTVSGNFSDLLVDALDNVNELHNKAGKATKAFELGKRDISLAEVMIARSKAGIATEAAIKLEIKL